MLKHACKTGLEGVVSKVRDSQYPIGRSNNWVKVTCAQRETLPIAGFALDGNKWDGLYVGRRKGPDLVYVGKVDLGFGRESAKLLRARLTPLIRETQPYSKRIAHRGMWVEPKLLTEVEYRAKSAEGKVRHPLFQGLEGGLMMVASALSCSFGLACLQKRNPDLFSMNPNQFAPTIGKPGRRQEQEKLFQMKAVQRALHC
jgi:bifunctional non-homologous end joining protein LigD